jgi:DNA uptake protein ComE-like DNA-binding protein
MTVDAKSSGRRIIGMGIHFNQCPALSVRTAKNWSGTIEWRSRFWVRRKSVTEEPTNRGDRDVKEERLKPFDLNTADEKSLAELQNIGPGRARTLIQYRPYKNWQEVENLPGFGPEIVDILAHSGVQIGQSADAD